MQDANVPWAFAMGNHDSEVSKCHLLLYSKIILQADLTDRQIAEFDSLFSLSYTQLGPRNIRGATNYVLPVYTNETEESKFNIWIFDSGNEACIGLPGKDL